MPSPSLSSDPSQDSTYLKLSKARHHWFSCLPSVLPCYISLLLLALLAGADAAAVPPCWAGGFAKLKEPCCDLASGPRGDAGCWDGVYTFERCCAEAVSKDQIAIAEKLGSYMNMHSNLLEDILETNNAYQLVDKTLYVQNGELEEVRVDRSEYVKTRVRFDFGAQVKHSSVRIYVHKLPECAGPSSVERLLKSQRNAMDTWSLYVQQHMQHILAVDSAILRSGHIVEDPAEATVFYVRAFWAALVQLDVNKIGNDDVRERPGDLGVECISKVFDALRASDYYVRNAAYDHFWSGGIQHPFNGINNKVFHIENHDVFAKNMMTMVSALREYGFSDKLFHDDVPMYTSLRIIFVPFTTKLDCQQFAALAQETSKRDIAVAFVGTSRSRMRRWLEQLSELPQFANDTRFHLGFGKGGDVRKAMLVDGGADLYAKTDFCLIMAGDMHDLTKRCYDAIAKGCLPIIVTAHRFWMSVPFASQVKWTSFARFERAASKADLQGLLERLAKMHEENQPSIRKRRMVMSKQVGLFSVYDEDTCTTEEKAAFPRLLVKELEGRVRAWPHMRASWLTVEEGEEEEEGE